MNRCDTVINTVETGKNLKRIMQDRDYLILKDGDRFYTKVNKNRLDRALRRVISALEIIEKELDEPYDIRDQVKIIWISYWNNFLNSMILLIGR